MESTLKNKIRAVCTAGLLLAANTPVWADSSYSESQRLSLQLTNVRISDVLSSVEKRSEYVFFYSDLIREELNKNVSVDAKAETIYQILSEVFQNTDLTFVINDRQIIIKHKNEVQQAPKGITINGTVRDAQQNPLIGVNVIIKGTTIGTTTDMNGNYFLEVPNKNAVLTFSYIGFESQEVKLTSTLTSKKNPITLKKLSLSVTDLKRKYRLSVLSQPSSPSNYNKAPTEHCPIT